MLQKKNVLEMRIFDSIYTHEKVVLDTMGERIGRIRQIKTDFFGLFA